MNGSATKKRANGFLLIFLNGHCFIQAPKTSANNQQDNPRPDILQALLQTKQPARSFESELGWIQPHGIFYVRDNRQIIS